jgi:hypothetical protein
MTNKIVNFKVNDNNPDDTEILEFFIIAKEFGLTQSQLCKLAIKRLILDILKGSLQDGLFSIHLINTLSQSEKITGSANLTNTPQVAKPDLEITDSEIETLPNDINDKMKNMLGGI